MPLFTFHLAYINAKQHKGVSTEQFFEPKAQMMLIILIRADD